VADHDRAAASPGEQAHEQRARVVVEVVARFVEQQKIGLVEPQRGERGARALAAAELRQRLCRIDAGKTDVFQRLGDARRQAPQSASTRSSGVPVPASSRASRAQASVMPSASATVACASLPTCWRSQPMRARRRTLPSRGACSPAISLSRVDLPTPLRPTSPQRSAPKTRSRSSKRTRPSGVAQETR